MSSALSTPHAAASSRDQLAAAAAATAAAAAIGVETTDLLQPAPPPSHWRIRRLWAPSLRRDRAVHVHATVLQAAIALSQWHKAASLEAKLAPVVPLAAHCILLAFVLLRPCAYWRCRDWALALAASLPLYRRTDTGLALLLHRAPQPGWRGAAMDALRAATGTRSLTMALLACFLVFPPLPALALQAGHSLASWNPGYCSTLLLAAPLAQQRQAALARVLELGSLPLAAVQPIAGQLAATFEDPHALCVATAAWLHIAVQLVLPTLFQAWLWTPPASPPPAPPPGASYAGWAWHQLRRAGDAGNRGVHLVLGGTAGPLARAAVAYYLLANAWLLVKA